MDGWDAIIEAKIAEAQRAGVFDDLPGAGKPLDLDDDRLVPEDVRMAYRILRNAGFVPAEIEERKEAADLRKLVAATTDDHPERKRALAKLALLEARMEARGSRLSGSEYYAHIARKLER
jgi:hypothetical protein